MSDLGISLEQPNLGQVPNAATPPVAQPNGQGAGSGPWANQLAQFDDAVRPSVDALLRTQVQPYLTQLEQQNAQLRDQAGLHQRLNESPAETYLQITSELFGDEAVDAVINLLAGDDDDDVADKPANEPKGDPELEAFRNEYRADKRRQAYDSEMERVKVSAAKRIADAQAAGQDPDDVPVDDRLFHTFVSMADGDFDRAYEGYKQFYGELRTAASGAPPATQGQPVVPPATLNSSNATTIAPPVEEHYESLEDAFDAYFNEVRASAPPTVGSV